MFYKHLIVFQNVVAFIFFKIYFIEVQLTYNVLISAVQQSDSVTHFSFFFLYGLSQDTEYSSLCYTVGLCLWSSLSKFLSSTLALMKKNPVRVGSRNLQAKPLSGDSDVPWESVLQTRVNIIKCCMLSDIMTSFWW